MNDLISGYSMRPKCLMLATLLTGWVIMIPSLPVSIQAEEVVFNRDVLPLLSKHCFACHGPDEAKREAALRLDTREGLFGDTGEALVVQAGDPAKSLLIERIYSHDEDDVMPPPEAKMPLNDDQRALLQKWVEQGASWGRALVVSDARVVHTSRGATKVLGAKSDRPFYSLRIGKPGIDS